MNVTYTKSLGRKILLVFLVFTAIFSIAALVVQKNITKKLNDVSNLATNVEHGQSKPEQALLLLHQAEDDFQEALLNTDSGKITSYKDKLSRAFDEIDTLLKEKPDTSRLTKGQNIQVKSWYNRKVVLSDKLYSLRHSFDSLLMVYTDLHDETANAANDLNSKISFHKNTTGNTGADTSVKAITPPKKGLIKRLKDAIVNKNNGYAVEINHHKNTEVSDSKTQKILAENRNAYAKKLQKLQQQNSKLLAMQRELNRLNSYISNELEGIISRVKDINYNMALEFKEMALKNYQETTNILNTFYMIASFLLLGFAVSLILFIDQINKAEVRLRRENELSVHTAQQKIDELLKKIMRDEDKHSPAKTEELKEIVELAINNNPAFLTKFNEFDTEFSKNLLNIAPNMVATEIEFCALLKLNFDTKEIARYTKSSVRAVEGKKYRIRKKLGIPSDHDINVWMTRV
jgi:DNA-binding CsgD family transcriptional regulator/3-dehydroquinate dehydratase